VSLSLSLSLIYFSLTNYKNVVHAQINKFVMLFVVMIYQEKKPWDVRFTVYPILLQVLILVVKYVVVDRLKLPEIDPYCAKRSM